MDPNTGELRRGSKKMAKAFGDLKKAAKDATTELERLTKQFEPIPDHLKEEAEAKLGGDDFAFTDLEDGSKLSKWAEKKRRQRNKRNRQVKACQEYYAGMRGFTFVELMISIAIVAILIFMAISSMRGIDVQERKINAIAFVNELRPDLEDLRATCSDKDSDGDGYVSCAVSGLNQKEEREIVNVECGSTACKVRMDD